jgi:DNA repair exonuclease SbcCD ATPase subunit
METKNNLPVSKSDTAITRTPAHVAADINAVKSHASAVFRAAVDEGKRTCILIGKLLEEAKSLVPHGEWGAWLKNNVDYSESTAQNLMRCYREFGDEQIDFFSGVSDADFFSILTQSQMLELLALPKDQRREFVEAHREEIEDGSLSTRQMRDEIDRLKREAAEKDEEIEAANGKIKNLTTELDEERKRPAPEPLEKVVVTHQPSPEQIEKIRAEEAAKADKRIEDLQKAQQLRIDATLQDKYKVEDALEKAKKAREKAEAERDAKEAALKKAHTDHEDELAKLTEKHEAELAAAREEGNAGGETAAEAAARIAELEKSLKMANPAVSEFRGLFEAANGIIVTLKGKLEAVRGSDPETAEKLDRAMAALAATIVKREASA